MDIFQPFIWYFKVFLIFAKCRLRNSFLLVFPWNLSSCFQKTRGNKGAFMHFIYRRYRLSCNRILFIIILIWSSLSEIILIIFSENTGRLEIFFRSKSVMIFIIIVFLMERCEWGSLISILQQDFTGFQSILLFLLQLI